jgi:hypothetical protein
MAEVAGPIKPEHWTNGRVLSLTILATAQCHDVDIGYVLAGLGSDSESVALL